MLTNPIAIEGSGLPVHADDAQHGGLHTCPGCHGGMVHVASYSRLGARDTRAHFRHQSGEDCGTGLETALHLWAKLVIERNGGLQLPPHITTYRDVMKRNTTDWKFTSVRLEPWMDGVRPDILLERADGGRLHVEILVTHRTGPEKISRIREMGHSALEIDLSGSRLEEVGSRDLERTILRTAPREWLVHENEAAWIDEAKAQWMLSVPARAIRLLEDMRRPPEMPASSYLAKQRRHWEIEDQISRTVTGGHWFRQPPCDWQGFNLSIALDILVDGETLPASLYEADRDWRRAGEEVRDLRIWPEVIEAAGLTPEEFSNPDRAVLAYLRMLCQEPSPHPSGAQWLLGETDGTFHLNPIALAYLRRKRDLERLVGEIVWVHDKDEARQFDTWFDLPVTPSGRMPRSLCLEGTPTHYRMVAHMEAIRNMKAGGSEARHLLGLADSVERDEASGRKPKDSRLHYVCPSHAMLKAGARPADVLIAMARKLHSSMREASEFMDASRDDMGGISPASFVVDVPTLQYAIARMPIPDIAVTGIPNKQKTRIW